MTVREEMEQNKRYMKAYRGDNDVKVLEIDTRKVTFQGKRYYELPQYLRRKFENLLVLAEPKQRLAFHYV